MARAVAPMLPGWVVPTKITLAFSVTTRILVMQWRVGCGYDVHRLVAGRPLVLGGVTIVHELGLDGHSDADVLSHSIADALLGALSLGDLGDHFPPTDERWRDANSIDLLTQVVAMVTAQGWQVGNIDATVIAEWPALASHRKAMISSLANACGVEIGQVSVKATTGEGLGFIGKQEGIAVQSAVLVSQKQG